MLNLGSLSIEDFDKVAKILKARFTDLQPENAPYVVLKKTSETQVIAMEGRYTKGHYIVEVFPVNAPIPNKAPDPVSLKDLDEACKYIEEATKEALCEY